MITLVKTIHPGFVTDIFSDAIRNASQGKTVFINQFKKVGPTVELCAGKLIWTRGADISVSSGFDFVILENCDLSMYKQFFGTVYLTVINPMFEFEDYDNFVYLKRFN